jgi:hypothetical protein
MVNPVRVRANLLDKLRVTEVCMNNAKAFMRSKMVEVPARSSAQIIYHQDRIATTQVAVNQVRSDKTASTCDQNVHVVNLAQGGFPKRQLQRVCTE